MNASVTTPQTGPVTLHRESSLKELIAKGHVVRVTAADFNGKTFDGSPVEVVGARDAPSPVWLSEDIVKGRIEMAAHGGTDYVSFCVPNGSGNPVWVGPGDFIIKVDDYNYTVVQGSLLQLLGAEDFMDLLVVTIHPDLL